MKTDLKIGDTVGVRTQYAIGLLQTTTHAQATVKNIFEDDVVLEFEGDYLHTTLEEIKDGVLVL